MLLYSASNGDWPEHVLLISEETRTYACTVVLGSAGRENTTVDSLRGLWRSAPVKKKKKFSKPYWSPGKGEGRGGKKALLETNYAVQGQLVGEQESCTSITNHPASKKVQKGGLQASAFVPLLGL